MQIKQELLKIISNANPLDWIRKLYIESHDWEYIYKQLQSLDNIKREFADTEQTVQANLEIKRIINKKLGIERVNDFIEVYLILAGCCIILSGIIFYYTYSYINSAIDLLNLTGFQVGIVVIIITIGLAFIILGMIYYLTKIFLKAICYVVQFFHKYH